MRYVQIIFEGKVQGVFFRKHTYDTAMRLELKGFVCNRVDGSVYIEAGGNTDQVQQLIEWCNKGPRKANVSSVHVKEIAQIVYQEFKIRGNQ